MPIVLAIPVIVEGILWAAATVGVVGTAHVVLPGKEEREQSIRELGNAMSMSNAQEDAKANADTSAAAATCATGTCANPCAHLACGVPGTRYRGGAHSCMKTPTGDALDSHHMPADSISPVNREIAPAIQMDPRDHRRTNSYGASAATNAVLAGQQNMISSGNFVGAQAIDVAEVIAKFPGKYDAAILQMEAYTACLKKHGLIK
jgi:hypothetical protein